MIASCTTTHSRETSATKTFHIVLPLRDGALIVWKGDQLEDAGGFSDINTEKVKE